jgi:hypothetical protein
MTLLYVRFCSSSSSSKAPRHSLKSRSGDFRRASSAGAASLAFSRARGNGSYSRATSASARRNHADIAALSHLAESSDSSKSRSGMEYDSSCGTGIPVAFAGAPSLLIQCSGRGFDANSTAARSSSPIYSRSYGRQKSTERGSDSHPYSAVARREPAAFEAAPPDFAKYGNAHKDTASTQLWHPTPEDNFAAKSSSPSVICDFTRTLSGSSLTASAATQSLSLLSRQFDVSTCAGFPSELITEPPLSPSQCGNRVLVTQEFPTYDALKSTHRDVGVGVKHGRSEAASRGGCRTGVDSCVKDEKGLEQGDHEDEKIRQQRYGPWKKPRMG